MYDVRGTPANSVPPDFDAFDSSLFSDSQNEHGFSYFFSLVLTRYQLSTTNTVSPPDIVPKSRCQYPDYTRKIVVEGCGHTG